MTPYEMALKYRGTKEIVGEKHNKLILKWFGLVGHQWVKDDETAWCAAFFGAMLEECGIQSTRKLNARSYETFGQTVPLEDAKPGDGILFWRVSKTSGYGHIAFFEKWMPNGKPQVFGGNQSNEVRSSVYERDQIIRVFRIPEFHEEEKVAPKLYASVRPERRESWLKRLIERIKERRHG